MREYGLGRILFAVSFAILGALSIGIHGFALTFPMVPKWIAWHDALSTLFGAILLVGGVGLLVPRAARISALLLAGSLLLRLLWIKLPHVAAHPLVEVVWEDMSENLIFVAGGWTIFSLLPREGGPLVRLGNVRVGQILFALALPAIGLSHMFYLAQTAPLIPAWIPFHVPLAYFTGAAYIAAAVAILSGVLARLAATLTAVMVSLFTLIVWVPIIMAAPSNLGDWSEFWVSAAISGSAWAVAESFRLSPWTWRRS